MCPKKGACKNILQTVKIVSERLKDFPYPIQIIKKAPQENGFSFIFQSVIE